jgi:hypothetical protein
MNETTYGALNCRTVRLVAVTYVMIRSFSILFEVLPSSSRRGVFSIGLKHLADLFLMPLRQRVNFKSPTNVLSAATVPCQIR